MQTEQMTKYSNFDEVVDDLQKLNHAIQDIRDRIYTECGVSFNSQDARHVALDGLQCDIAACGCWIRSLMSLKTLVREKHCSNWDENYRQLIGTGLPSGQAEDLMLDYLRNTITTKVHFKIENLFKNILQHFSVKVPGKFWCIRDNMLEKAGIDTEQSKNILTALANLRNSFHSNGMHDKDCLSVEIGGIKFDFCKGEPVKCASWKHIVVLIRENIAVLNLILLSDSVKNITIEIQDRFAADNH